MKPTKQDKKCPTRQVLDIKSIKGSTATTTKEIRSLFYTKVRGSTRKVPTSLTKRRTRQVSKSNELQARVSETNYTMNENSWGIIHKAGRLKHCLQAWQKLTSDHYILNVVKGLEIDFEVQRKQVFVPKQYNFNDAEVQIIDARIEEFLESGIIETATHAAGEYISNIFIRPKRNGSYRLILNLESLNEYIEYHHFRKENLKSAISLMRPNC